MLRPTIVALIALLFSPAVLAQEDRGPHWHVSGGNQDAFMTTNIHAAQKLEDGTVLASSAMYFSTRQTLDNDSFDFALTVEQFDCTVPYRYRTVSAEGYLAGVGPATFQAKDLKASWRTTTGPTLSGMRWSMVCEKIPENSALYGVETHEDVLDRYRQSVNSEGSGSGLPDEAEQILRDLTI